MKSHQFDPVSLVLGLAVSGLGVLGLLFAGGELDLVDVDVDLRFLVPVALVAVAAGVLSLTLATRRRAQQTGRRHAEQEVPAER